MPPRKTAKDTSQRIVRPPATTPEGRERQLTALAVDEAERQMREGTASAQIVVHYLKLAGQKEALELEKLKLEAKLLEARAEQLGSAQRTEELYAEAMKAFKTYKTGEEADED